MQCRFTEKFGSFYFIGIGGVSMSGLAKFLISYGKKVGGSDIAESHYTNELRKLGALVECGGKIGSIGEYEAVVYTDAIRENDVQMIEAKKLKKEMISRGQLLYEVSRNFSKVIAVSGCHGKTTCTAMLAHIFSCAQKRFAVHMGGNDRAFGNFYFRGNEYFITEACEYKKNFLLLTPDIAVILNTDADHLDSYNGLSDLASSYKHFARGADTCVSLYGAQFGGVTFGFSSEADFYAKSIAETRGIYSFCAYDGKNKLGTVSLNVYGKHNVLNALAAIATARLCGIPFSCISEGLSDFYGVERRFEKIGSVFGAECIADYAHHPNEIRAALRTAGKVAKGRLFVVFQPHTYSRTKALFADFVKVLSPQNHLLIYRTFAAREYFDDAGSALTLAQSIKKARYGDCEQDIIDFISHAKINDMILFLGAGDIYDIALKILKELS